MPSKFSFSVGEKVIYDDICRNYPENDGRGEIIGIALDFPIITFYIVLLDEPVKYKETDRPWRGFLAQGSSLTRIPEEPLTSYNE